MMSQSKKAQMKIVRETGFAMLDAALYLDTHQKMKKPWIILINIRLYIEKLVKNMKHVMVR